MTGDGNQDILVGRDDGTVEVYALDDSGEPRLKASHVRMQQNSLDTIVYYRIAQFFDGGKY